MNDEFIKKITNPLFLKNFSFEEVRAFCDALRQFLITNLQKSGGHFSSNLGVVELTTMLHKKFNFTHQDKLIFDIGHQAYTHKILTGRVLEINSIRKAGGLSGFQSISETKHDHWEAGHAGTSLSASLGMACGLQERNAKKPYIVTFIGDASISNGIALEALNDIGNNPDYKIIIILNDNGMSISKNINFLNYYASHAVSSNLFLKTSNKFKKILKSFPKFKKLWDFYISKEKFIKLNITFFDFFKFFNLDYIGPFNGHDLHNINIALNKAISNESSIVVHFKTTKGNGWCQAELDTVGDYHSINSGNKVNKMLNWPSVISSCFLHHIAVDQKVRLITPGMIKGSDLSTLFNNYPQQCFDVGIAEEHAVTMAAGMSLTGLKPIVCIYSTFLQRAYDQINHDICGLNRPVFFAVDRSGFATGDGRTHHGIFDINLLSNLPYIKITHPFSPQEAYFLINYWTKNPNCPFVMRYAKNEIWNDHELFAESKLEFGKWRYNAAEINDKSCLILSYGADLNYIYQLLMKHGLMNKFALVNAWFLKPLDETSLLKWVQLEKSLIVFERLYYNSGLGAIINNFLVNKGFSCMNLHLLSLQKVQFFNHGNLDYLLQDTNLSADNIVKFLTSL